mgnify:CR=1 FL=1
MTVVLFAAGAALWPEYEAPLRRALAEAGLAVDLVCEAAPEAVDYIIYAPGSPVQDFTPYTRCKAVLNLWAGVERIVGNATLTQPLCRMVDPALTMGMVEWVVGHALRYHLGMDRHIVNPAHVWDPTCPPLAREPALLLAARVRLRPILMTTLAMVFGMVPLAFALTEGSEQRAPMGQAVIGGVITSSLLTLVVVPVVYCYLDDFTQWCRQRLGLGPRAVLSTGTDR